MESFYNFIDLLYSKGYEAFEDKKTFKIEFKYSDDIKDFLKYTSICDIKNFFFDCINLYVYKKVNNEENIIDYLEEREEFYEKVNELNESYNLKLIINKDKFIKIKVPIDSNLVFYVNESTLIDFFNNDINFLENTFFNKNKKNVFICGDSDQFLFNEFYMITNFKRQDFLKEITDFNNDIWTVNINNIIDKRNELCNWVDGSHFLTPEVLHVDINNLNFIISDKFKTQLFKKNIDLIIPFISNFTGNISNEYISVINGNKRIEIKYDLNLEDYNSEIYYKLYKLYKWIYGESTFDKINICRNVISILVTAKCQGSEYRTILQNSDWLLKSVQDNFNEFLQKNIDSYFKEKNTIIDKLSENILSINNQTSELTKLIITNITSLLGTAVAAVVGYIAKGEVMYIKMLIFLYLCFLVTNTIFNLPINIIRARQSKNDFDYNKNLYIKLYTDDDKINQLIKRNKFNNKIFYIYTFFTIALIAFIIIFLVNADINVFINRFK